MPYHGQGYPAGPLHDSSTVCRNVLYPFHNVRRALGCWMRVLGFRLCFLCYLFGIISPCRAVTQSSHNDSPQGGVVFEPTDQTSYMVAVVVYIYVDAGIDEWYAEPQLGAIPAA